MTTTGFSPLFVQRKSFIELDGRRRAYALFDENTATELVSPFDRAESPWLPMQGVVPQSDDGCIVIKGKISGKPAVAISLEGVFQGGSIGEVSGAKMVAAFCSKLAVCAYRKPIWGLRQLLKSSLPFLNFAGMLQ